MINKIKRKFESLVNDSNFKEVLHGSIYSLGAKIIASLLGIVTSIIGARYYGAEMIGMVAIIGIILNIAGLFALFGMNTSLLRLIPEYINKYSMSVGVALYKKFLFLVFITSIIVGGIVIIFAKNIANDIFHESNLTVYILIAAGVLILQSIGSINLTMLRSLKKIKIFAFYELLPKLITLVLLLLLTFIFYDKYNLMYIAFSVIIIMSICTSFSLSWYMKPYKKGNISYILPTSKNILSISFPMMLIGGLFLIIGQTDIIMIGIFRSTQEVGVYGIIFSLAMITNFVLSSINVMASPKFSELYHLGKMNELRHVAQKSSKLMFWSTLPILLTLLLLGKIILGFYGEEFSIGYVALILLIVGQFINAASGSVGHILNMTGHQNQFRNIMFIAAIINIVMNYLLLPTFGINGAAFSSLTSVLFWNAAALVFIKKEIGFSTLYFPHYSRKTQI